MGTHGAKCGAWCAVALAAALLAAPAPRAWSRGEAAAYRKDLAYLLDELPKKARTLLREKDVDWPKATKSLRAAARKVSDAADYVRLVQRIVARLEDGHAGIVKVSPDLEGAWKDACEEEAHGRRWTGPRVHLLLVGDDVYVGEAFGEAADRGVRVGMQVLEIDRVPARRWVEQRADAMSDTEGFSTRRSALFHACHWGLADWEGTPTTFDLRAGREHEKVTITRHGGPDYAPAGPILPPEGLRHVGRQSWGKTAHGFGYVHLRDVPTDLPRQLDEILEGIGDVPGLVLDMRGNGGGGTDHEAVFGRFLAPGTRWRRYTSQGSHPFAGPMVVIVDGGVVSAGETVAGIFKEDGRAYVIGPEPTSGTSSQKVLVEVPSGNLTVRVSVESNEGRFNAGRGIEGIGVPPNEITPYDPAELLEGVDTQIRRAEELLQNGFPKGAVPYEPPGK
jgi:carboxyl-terminal processing protease